jgi:hypothetical protein
MAVLTILKTNLQLWEIQINLENFKLAIPGSEWLICSVNNYVQNKVFFPNICDVWQYLSASLMEGNKSQEIEIIRYTLVISNYSSIGSKIQIPYLLAEASKRCKMYGKTI